jgi:hypothetical protein
LDATRQAAVPQDRQKCFVQLARRFGIAQSISRQLMRGAMSREESFRTSMAAHGIATPAAKAIRAKLAVPSFADTSAKATHFNDLH